MNLNSTGMRSKLSWLIGLSLVALFLGTDIWSAFRYQDYRLSHDEAEHLHVVYALERGERPYIDFLENHPVLPHLGLMVAAQSLNLAEPAQVYQFARTVIAVHFLGTLAILWLMTCRWRRTSATDPMGLALFATVIWLSGIWAQSTEWTWGHRSLWHLRPDWICLFYAILGTYLHYRSFDELLTHNRRLNLLLLAAGAVCVGLSTAILAKSILVFIPYVLTIVVVASLWPERSRAQVSNHRRPILVGNVLFVGTALLVSAVLVTLEIRGSGTTLAAYVASNFELNSFKHIPLNAHDFNPLNILRSLSGLSFPALVGTLAWLIHRFALSIRQDDMRLAGGLLLIWFAVAINIVFPAYGNGLAWPWYFIPSLLALWVALYLIGHDALQLLALTFRRGGYFERISSPRSPLRYIAITALMLIAAIEIAVHALATLDRARATSQARRDTAILLGTQLPAFLLETRLPSDLTYFVFEPQQKPANARAWGYFHMLSHDAMWWVDNHRFGFGPDPEDYWRTLYGSQPPDVIALTGVNDFISRRTRIGAAQGIELSWLWGEVKKSYTCVTDGLIRLQVRNTLLGRFSSGTWRTCPPSPYDFTVRKSNDYAAG